MFKVNKNAIFVCFRLSKSHILVSGLRGTAIEVLLIIIIFLKNSGLLFEIDYLEDLVRKVAILGN